MQIKCIIFVFLIFTTNYLIAKDLNYTPKALIKDLDKNWDLSINALEELEELSKQLVTEGKFYALIESNELKGFVFIGRVFSCRVGGCDNKSKRISNVGYEYFDAYIIFDANKKVKTVNVFNYQALHGHEITSKGWLKQFINFTGENRLQVGKDIDAISGATISVNAITDEVNYLTELLNLYN